MESYFSLTLYKYNVHLMPAGSVVEYTDCISAESKRRTQRVSNVFPKQSDGEAPVLELWEIWSTSSLPLLPDSLWPVVVIYKALCADVAQGRMNGVPNENRTHSCRFASLSC